MRGLHRRFRAAEPAKPDLRGELARQGDELQRVTVENRRLDAAVAYYRGTVQDLHRDLQRAEGRLERIRAIFRSPSLTPEEAKEQAAQVLAGSPPRAPEPEPASGQHPVLPWQVNESGATDG